MRINKVVKKAIVRGPEEGATGTNVAAGISAVVSANIGDEAGSESNQVSSRQDVRIVQRSEGASPRRGSENGKQSKRSRRQL